MKKILKYIPLAGVGLALALLNSCSENDDHQGASLVKNYTPYNITLTVNENNVTIDEASILEEEEEELVYTVTATIPETSPVDYVIDLVQTGGSADAGDYEADVIVIPTGLTSGTGNITFHPSGDVEGNETLTLKAVPRGNAVTNDFVFTATITNDYINDVMSVSVDWAGEYSETDDSGVQTSFEFCDMDFDLYILDSDMNTTDIYAESGDCPETLDISGLPNGTYYLYLSLWSNPFSALGTSEDVPITVTYNQDVIGTSGEFTLSEIFNTGSADGEDAILATIEISNSYEYTITPEVAD